MDADVWARTQTYMHERTRMGTDTDVRGQTRTDAGVLWDLSERTRTHVNKRTQVLGGRTGEKNTRYAAGYIQCLGSQKNANALCVLLICFNYFRARLFYPLTNVRYGVY